MIPNGLLPPGAVHAAVHIDEWAARQRGAGTAGVSTLEGVAERRRREFEAGRFCAAAAIEKLVGAPVVFRIGRRRDGSPVWPDAIVGAITHTDTLAAAAVMRAEDATGLGLDAQPFMSCGRAVSVARHIVDTGELSAIAEDAALEPHEALTLAFSAKEAIFKCLYPSVHRMFDYRDAAVERVDLQRRRFVARLLRTLSPDYSAGSSLEGRVVIEAGIVFTVVHIDRRP